MLKSAKMAQYMNENVPGIEVPDALIEEIDAAEDKAAASIAITARIIARIRPLCAGVHIMPLGWEDKIPAVLEAVSALTSEG
jgi:5,10-methylenetetrahydrofolate reductase